MRSTMLPIKTEFSGGGQLETAMFKGKCFETMKTSWEAGAKGPMDSKLHRGKKTLNKKNQLKKEGYRNGLKCFHKNTCKN